MPLDFLDLLHAAVQSSDCTMEIVVMGQSATARPFGDALPITIDCKDLDGLHDVMFSTSLGRPRREREARVDALLLEANHLGLGTSGCTLGRDSPFGNISIFARLPLDLLDSTSLHIALRAFHQVASNWHSNIHHGHHARSKH